MQDRLTELSWVSIKPLKWNQVVGKYRWLDFRLAYYPTETKASTLGVLVDLHSATYATQTDMKVFGVLIVYPDKEIEMATETDMYSANYLSATNYLKILLHQLPWYDLDNITIRNLCTVFDMSFRFLDEKEGQTTRNQYLDTAIEILPYYENLLGIITDEKLGVVQRRNQVRSVLNAIHQPTNQRMIKELCASFSNNQAGAVVTKTDKENVFKIEFVANGIPNNIDGLNKILMKIFPADEAWEFSYVKNTWKEKATVRWKDVQKITWNNFITYQQGGMRT